MLPWRGEMYLLKPQAQHEWGTSFFSYIRSCLSFSPISFGHFLASDLALYHTYVFYHHHDTTEEDLENERKSKESSISPKPGTSMSP